MSYYLPKEVNIIACFADQRYERDGRMLEISAYGRGTSLAIAVNRAFRNVLQDPQIKHKSPNYIYISIGADGSYPVEFWRLFHKRDSAEEAPEPG